MKIVFDTNVLISNFLFGGFSAEVYDYCYIFHEIYISDWIIDELCEKLNDKFNIPKEIINRILDKINEGCKIVNPDTENPIICRDADDNNILNLGLFANCDYIITGDHDLLDLGEYKGIKIINPRNFWIEKSKF